MRDLPQFPQRSYIQWVGEKMEKMGVFRNIDLNQYNWQIHKFSINECRKGLRRTYRGPIFNIGVGKKEIACCLSRESLRTNTGNFICCCDFKSAILALVDYFVSYLDCLLLPRSLAIHRDGSA
jgi:hypothetical protein